VHESAQEVAWLAGRASGWRGWMAGVLRDEESGICSRDTHDLCSTGSQLSWLPTTALEERGAIASHLFTAASDPLVCAYKRFGFAHALGGGALSFASPELWQRHCTFALGGGMVDALGVARAREAAAALGKLEAEALAAAAGATNGELSSAAPPFAAAVAKELVILSGAP